MELSNSFAQKAKNNSQHKSPKNESGGVEGEVLC